MKLGGPDPTWGDAELVAACRDGERAAWDALIEKYSRLVYSVPARYQLPPEEAADVFQSVWFDLYRDLANLQKAGSLRSWLITAAARRCLLQKRNRQRLATGADTSGLIGESDPDPLRLRQEAEERGALHDAIESLPARCRSLVRMLFFEEPGVSYAEAARRLGLAEGSIGFVRGRCLTKLKRALQERGAR